MRGIILFIETEDYLELRGRQAHRIVRRRLGTGEGEEEDEEGRDKKG